MSVIILVALVCVFLYALYVHLGPFSHCGDSFADKIVNVLAVLLWIGLPIPLAMMIVPDQATLFGTIVYIVGCVLALMAVELMAAFLLFCFVAWLSYSVFYHPSGAITKRAKKNKTAK